MSRIPRLLPLVGVAIGGVIAANALGGAHALPGLLSATQAAAEEVLHPKSGKHAQNAPGAPDPSTDAPAPKGQTALPPGMNGQPGGQGIAPVCAPSATDLAKAAGLSPAELQVLQSLQTRRGQIDDREKDLDTEVQLLAAAEAKLDGKLKSMNSLKGDIQALMGQADVKTQADIANLVTVYSKMKPQDAAAIMTQLDDKVRLPIAIGMKATVLSAILSKMAPADAKALTEKLAHRFAPMQALAQAANAPVAATAPPPAPSKGAKANQAATADQAADDTDDAPADAKASPAKKPVAKKRVARAAPKKAPAKSKPPVAVAKADTPALPSKPQPYPATKDAAAAGAANVSGPAKTR